jgi:putative membrane protein insertion efficiency factor
MIARLVLGLIRLYQATLSPLFGSRCRFHPSCSEYAAEAIATHGLVRGCARALWRLARCGPWTRGGLDPVPPARRSLEVRVG